MSQQEAWMFPVFGSCVLFSLYIAFKFLGKDVVNLLMGLYFAAISILVVQQTLAPVIGTLLASVRRRVMRVKQTCMFTRPHHVPHPHVRNAT